MSKFAAMGVSDEGTSKMTIINPNTGYAYRDKDGNDAFIEIGHLHGPEGRMYDQQQQRRAAQQEPIAGFNAGESYLIRKCAALTKQWYLVGHDGAPMDLAFSPEAAVELYSHRWMFMQVVDHASAYGNFTKA